MEDRLEDRDRVWADYKETLDLGNYERVTAGAGMSTTCRDGETPKEAMRRAFNQSQEFVVSFLDAVRSG